MWIKLLYNVFSFHALIAWFFLNLYTKSDIKFLLQSLPIIAGNLKINNLSRFPSLYIFFKWFSDFSLLRL